MTRRTKKRRITLSVSDETYRRLVWLSERVTGLRATATAGMLLDIVTRCRDVNDRGSVNMHQDIAGEIGEMFGALVPDTGKGAAMAARTRRS